MNFLYDIDGQRKIAAGFARTIMDSFVQQVISRSREPGQNFMTTGTVEAIRRLGDTAYLIALGGLMEALGTGKPNDQVEPLNIDRLLGAEPFCTEVCVGGPVITEAIFAANIAAYAERHYVRNPYGPDLDRLLGDPWTVETAIAYVRDHRPPLHTAPNRARHASAVRYLKSADMTQAKQTWVIEQLLGAVAGL